MSIKTVYAAIKYATGTLERLSEVTSEQDQDDIAAALLKLGNAKEELNRMVRAGELQLRAQEEAANSRQD